MYTPHKTSVFFNLHQFHANYLTIIPENFKNLCWSKLPPYWEIEKWYNIVFSKYFKCLYFCQHAMQFVLLVPVPVLKIFGVKFNRPYWKYSKKTAIFGQWYCGGCRRCNALFRFERTRRASPKAVQRQGPTAASQKGVYVSMRRIIAVCKQKCWPLEIKL